MSSEGYKSHIPSNGNITFSRNVKFNEEDIWDCEAHESNYYAPPLYKEEQTRESLEKIIAPASFPPPLTHKDQIQCHLHGKAQAKGHHISGVYKKFMRQ